MIIELWFLKSKIIKKKLFINNFFCMNYDFWWIAIILEMDSVTKKLRWNQDLKASLKARMSSQEFKKSFCMKLEGFFFVNLT